MGKACEWRTFQQTDKLRWPPAVQKRGHIILCNVLLITLLLVILLSLTLLCIDAQLFRSVLRETN